MSSFLLVFFSNFKKNFDLNGIPETYFWKSQFESFDPRDVNTPVSIYYLVYRFLYMMYSIVTLLACFTCFQNEDYYFLMYLTNQTIVLQLLYGILYFAYVLRKLWTRKVSSPFSSKHRLPLIAKMIWILMNVVHTVPHVVSFVYWIFLSDDQKEFKEQCRFTRNYFAHSFNVPVALIDAIVTSVPIMFSHFVFPLIDALWYTIFSVTYEVSGGPLPENKTSIYNILYWKSPNGPGAAIKTCVEAVAAGFFFFVTLCWGLSRVKFTAARYLNVGPEQVPKFAPELVKGVPTEFASGIKLSTLEKSPSLDPNGNGYCGNQNLNSFGEAI